MEHQLTQQAQWVRSGNEAGPFRAIEESTLAQLTPFRDRDDVFAWYNLIGTLGP